MLEKIFDFCIRKKTKNLTNVPLLVVTFDFQAYKQCGKLNSCIRLHPDIAKDEFVMGHLCKVLNHIKENYDPDIFTRI